MAEEGDVYDALTDKYLAHRLLCISPNDQRLQLLRPDGGGVSGRRGDRRHLQACHTYAVESLAIKRHLHNSTIFLTWRLKPTIRQRTSASAQHPRRRLYEMLWELA